MGLLSILLLCLFCFLGFGVSAPTIDVDCDGQNIFDAVDEALKSYNGAKLNGNKFILYRITDARIRQENSSLIHNFVTFDIRESLCPVNYAIPWKECDFKLDDAERGQCSAHILVNTEQNTKEVFSQNCSITPKVIEPTVSVINFPCLGCFQPINPNSEELPPLIQHAIEKMNKVGNHPFYFGLENVAAAKRQVVRGWNYILDYEIRQTNCSKSMYREWSAGECKIDLNGQSGNCNSRMFVDPHGEILDIDPKCSSSSGFCLECPNAVETSAPEVQALVKQFVEKYNSESNSTDLFDVDKISEATRNVEPDKKKYKLQFSIQKTNCTKFDHAILEDVCVPIQTQGPGNHYFCEVTVAVVNETADILPDSTCFQASVQLSRAVMRGFSPLRSALPLKRGTRASEKSRGKEHGQNKNEEKHGKKDKQEKKDKGKKNNDCKKDCSSEESEEDHRKMPEAPTKQTEIPIVPQRDTIHPPLTEKITKLPIVQPPTPAMPKFPPSSGSISTAPEFQESLTPDVSSTTVAIVTQNHEETLRDIDESILELLLPPPPNVRKCPGKEWKPLLSIPPISTERPFIIGDLFSALDDLAPAEEKSPEKSFDVNPPRSFNDEDLLSALEF